MQTGTTAREKQILMEKNDAIMRLTMNASRLNMHALSNHIAALRAIAYDTPLLLDYSLLLYKKYRTTMRALHEKGYWTLKEELEVIFNDIEIIT